MTDFADDDKPTPCRSDTTRKMCRKQQNSKSSTALGDVASNPQSAALVASFNGRTHGKRRGRILWLSTALLFVMLAVNSMMFTPQASWMLSTPQANRMLFTPQINRDNADGRGGTTNIRTIERASDRDAWGTVTDVIGSIRHFLMKPNRGITPQRERLNEYQFQNIIPVSPNESMAGFELCKHHNHVLRRYTKNKIDHDGSNAKPFSAMFLFDQSGVQESASTAAGDDDERAHVTMPSKDCETVQEFVTSIRDGHRVWPDAETANNADFPSWFVPFGCRTDMSLSTEDVMEMLGQFSNIFWLGDSISRQSYIGFRMLLSQDFISGGKHLLRNASGNNRGIDPSAICQCDGLFSEHDVCRAYEKTWRYFNVTSIDHQGDSLTTSLAYEEVRETNMMAEYAESDFKDIQCGEDKRPVLVIVQGGLHMKVEPVPTLELFHSIWHHPKLRECEDNGTPIVFIWMGLGAQHKSLDPRFPHQAWEPKVRFNRKIDSALRSNNSSIPSNVIFMDILNMTKNAETSDGVHAVIDVNYMQAVYSLRIADAVVREQSFARLPRD